MVVQSGHVLIVNFIIFMEPNREIMILVIVKEIYCRLIQAGHLFYVEPKKYPSNMFLMAQRDVSIIQPLSLLGQIYTINIYSRLSLAKNSPK